MRGRDGLSILEIVIGVVLLVIGILPILQSHVVSSEAVRFNRDEVTAANLCCQVLERYKLEPLEFLQAAGADLSPLIAEDPILSPWVQSADPGQEAVDKAYERIVSRFKRRARFEVLAEQNGLVTHGKIICAVTWLDQREGRSKERHFKAAVIVCRHHYPKGRP